MASLLYKLPKPDFEKDNIYVFEFQVGYVDLFFRKTSSRGEGKEESEEGEGSKKKEVEETPEEEEISKDDISISLGGEELDSDLDEEDWMDIKLEDLQINALTTKEEYKMIFMNGIEIKETNRVVISNQVKAILHSLDKIKVTKEDIKNQIDLLDVHQGLMPMNTNEEVEREFETYEKSDNPAKHFTEPEGFLDTLDLEDLPLPSVKRLKVSMALYDIKLIQVEEDRFMINMPLKKTEMEEEEDPEMIYNVTDYKLIPVPQFPVDEDNLSQTDVMRNNLKNKCTYKAITSLRPNQMIERIETIPLLIDISEFDRLALLPIKTIGMSKLGYLGNRFIDVVKTNAQPNAPSPNSCIKDVVLPIINNHDVVVGEIKVILKLVCYNRRAWPDFPPRLQVTPSMQELLESEHLMIESIQAETSDIDEDENEWLD